MSPSMRPSRALPASVPAGVLATLTMDAAMVVASCCAPATFSSSKIGLDMIGRWAGGFARGRRRPRLPAGDISDEPRLPGESAIGLAVHYLTGIALTEAYLVMLRRRGLKPGLAAGVGSATAYGLATAVLPLFVMYPSMGYGCCGLRSGEAARLRRVMLLGHVAFGAGIGLATALPCRGRQRSPRRHG